MKLIKLSTLRYIDRNKYASVRTAQRNGHIREHYQGSDLYYDEDAFKQYKQRLHRGRPTKNKPIIQYRIDALAEMTLERVLEINQSAVTKYPEEALTKLWNAISELKE